jgi:hypothetical protein
VAGFFGSWVFVATRNLGSRARDTPREFISMVLFIVWTKYKYLHYFNLIYKLQIQSNYRSGSVLESIYMVTLWHFGSL